MWKRLFLILMAIFKKEVVWVSVSSPILGTHRTFLWEEVKITMLQRSHNAAKTYMSPPTFRKDWKRNLKKKIVAQNNLQKVYPKKRQNFIDIC